MRNILIAAPLLLAACVPADPPATPTCGVATPAEVIGYTKEGSPIRMEPPLIAPCPIAEPEPPIAEPDPEQPVVSKPKCNSGRGNGSEGSPDCDPTNWLMETPDV